MNIKQKIKDIVPEMTKWRHQIHEKPETAYQEKVTSKFIANKLKDFGVEVIEEFVISGIISLIFCLIFIFSTLNNIYTF